MCENWVKPTVDSDTCTLQTFTYLHYTLHVTIVGWPRVLLDWVPSCNRSCIIGEGRRALFKWSVGVQFCRGHARWVRLSVRETLVLVRTRRNFKKKNPTDYLGTGKVKFKIDRTFYFVYCKTRCVFVWNQQVSIRCLFKCVPACRS